MSDQLQRELKYSNHASRQMTEMIYLLEKLSGGFHADVPCQTSHINSRALPCLARCDRAAERSQLSDTA